MTVSTQRRGMIIVLSSPSGAGKSTLAHMILQHNPHITMSISVTTRIPRRGEQEGVDYYFISEQEFHQRNDRGDLLESAQVFDHYYGSPRTPVFEALESGTDVLFDIDWQGAQQLRAAGKDAISIFILPPSRAELEQRLRRRSTDSEEVIARRMSKADQEISHFKEYDWVLVNRDLDATFEQIVQIIATERLRLHRQPNVSEFAKGLLSPDFASK